MRKKEKITFTAFILMLTIVVLAGRPAGNNGRTEGFIRADAAEVSATPTSSPTPTAKPTATPTPTQKVTPTPTSKVTSTPTPTPMPAEDATLLSITAYYWGDALEVGSELDFEQLKVIAYWSDGTSVRLQKGEFDISDTVVLKEGSNKIVVIYKGNTTSFYVYGKTLKSISASCSKFSYGIKNGVDTRDLTVIAVYSNGSTETIKKDYVIEPAEFTATGSQEVTIKYKGCEYKFKVNVKEIASVKTLSVSYSGSELIQDQKIDRENLDVIAVYSDATYSSERIATYTMSAESFSKTGENILTVSYLGMEAKVKINVLAKKITAMSAEYDGGEVEIGSEYDPAGLHVYLTYNDGVKAEISDYSVYDPVIRYLGENTLKIYYGDYNTTCKINGIEVSEPDFSYTSDFTIKSGSYKFTISTAIPKRLETDCVAGSLVKKTKLTKAYRKLNSKTGWYCAFDYQFADGDNEVYLPVTIRITLPNEMEPEYTEIYHTPNKKTILGMTNKEIVDEHTIEIVLFKVGTYMIVYDPEAYAEEEPEAPDTDD